MPSQLVQQTKSAAAQQKEVLASSITDRVLRFADHVSVQTLAGIVGGLVGTFLDGRYFAALGLIVSYGLYRSRALAGLRERWVLPAHVTAVTIAASLLFLMGEQLNKSRPQAYTPADYARAVKNSLPLPIIQHITNIYKTYQQRNLEGPRVDHSELNYDGRDGNNLVFHTEATNNGQEPALDLEGSTWYRFGDKSINTENALFDYLESRVSDAFQPRGDLAPGIQYQVSEPTVIPVPAPDQFAQISSGLKAEYIGRIDRYRDRTGNSYESQLCMYWSNSEEFHFCDGHNWARMLKAGTR